MALVVIIPAGYYSKIYSGPAQAWVANSLGGVFYEVFWCLVLAVFFPRTKPLIFAIVVFFTTTCLELLQLWHPSFLESVRSAFVGRVLLGTTFNPMDFPYYAAGCLAGWFMLNVFARVVTGGSRTSGPPWQ